MRRRRETKADGCLSAFGVFSFSPFFFFFFSFIFPSRLAHLVLYSNSTIFFGVFIFVFLFFLTSFTLVCLAIHSLLETQSVREIKRIEKKFFFFESAKEESD